VSVASLHRARA